MSNNETVEDKQTTYKPEDFAKAYEDLCTKMGYRVVVSPQYVARDDNSFSTVLQYTVGKIAK